MALIRFMLVGVGIFSLLIPFNVAYAQFKITGSEGTKIIGDPSTTEKSGTQSQGKTWTRVYAPGEQERLYRQAEQRERWETQQKAREEAEARKAYQEKQRIKQADKALQQDRELRERELDIREKEAKRPIIVNTPPPIVNVH